MRFLITSISGRKGYKSFKTLNEYVDFMTKNSHLIKDLKEAEVPYTEKPVDMVKATQSKGWEEVSDFGNMMSDGEKSESLMSDSKESIMKDDANMEFSKSSEKKEEPKEEKKDFSKKYDKEIEECLLASGVVLNEDWEEISEKEVKSEKADSLMTDDVKEEAGMEFSKSSEKKEDKKEKGLGGESGDINMKDYKKFDYSEPELDTEKNKSKAQVEYKEVKTKVTESKGFSKKLTEDMKTCLKNAGVKQLNEFFKYNKPQKEEQTTNEQEDNKVTTESIIEKIINNGSVVEFYKYCSKFFNSLSDGMNADTENEQSLIRFTKGLETIIRKVTKKSEYSLLPYNIVKAGMFIESLPTNLKDTIVKETVQMICDNCDEKTINKFYESLFNDSLEESKKMKDKKAIVEEDETNVPEVTDEIPVEVTDEEENELEMEMELRSAKDLIKAVSKVLEDDEDALKNFVSYTETVLNETIGAVDYPVTIENLKKVGKTIDILQTSLKTEIINKLTNYICNNTDESTFTKIVDEIKNGTDNDEEELDEFFKFEYPEGSDETSDEDATFDEEFINSCKNMPYDVFFKKCKRYFGEMGSNTLSNFKKSVEIVNSFQNDSDKVDFVLKTIYDNCDEGCRNRFVEYVNKILNEAFAGERKIGISFSFVYDKDPADIENVMHCGRVNEDRSLPENGYEFSSVLLRGTPRSIQSIMNKLNKLLEMGVSGENQNMRIYINGELNKIYDWGNNLEEVKSLLMDKEKISEGVWGAITGAGIGSLSGHPYAGASIGYIVGELVYNLLVNWTKAKTQEQFIQKLKKYSKDPHTFLEKGYKEIDKMQLLSDREKQEAKDKLAQMFVDSMRDSFSNEEDKEIEECLKKEKISEGIKDYLPRAGFIRDDDEDKSSSKMGVWGGQGTDEQLRKAKIIAKVKFANGDRFGRVTKADLDNFDEYKAQYDEIYGSDELDEGWKDKLKKGAAAIGVAGALASNAMANDTGRYDYDFNPNHYEQVELDANDCRNAECTFGDEHTQSKVDIEKPIMKGKTANGMVIDQFGNEWTKEDFHKLQAGKDPTLDFSKTSDIEESEEVIEEDDGMDSEIAECLRLAGC